VECKLLNKSFNVLSSSLKVISSIDGGSNVSFDCESSCSSSTVIVSSYKLGVISVGSI